MRRRCAACSGSCKALPDQSCALPDMKHTRKSGKKTIGSRLSFANCCRCGGGNASIAAGSTGKATEAKRRQATCFRPDFRVRGMSVSDIPGWSGSDEYHQAACQVSRKHKQLKVCFESFIVEDVSDIEQFILRSIAERWNHHICRSAKE